MSNDTSQTNPLAEEYPNTMTPGKRLVVILILASMLIPIAMPVFVTLVGGLLLIGKTWAAITTLLATAVGWYCLSVARKHSLNTIARWILSLVSAGGVIAISALLALLMAWWSTSLIIFENETGQSVDVMMAVDEHVYLYEDLHPNGSVLFSSQKWRDKMSLHIDLYYHYSQLDTMTQIRMHRPRRMKFQIGSEGVLTAQIPGDPDQEYQPMLVLTEEDLLKVLPQ